jgi:hypothetical protein
MTTATVTGDKPSKALAGSSSPTPAGSVVSLTLDSETYDWFGIEAFKDDRTISKFIARHLRAYVLAEKKKREAEEKF